LKIVVAVLRRFSIPRQGAPDATCWLVPLSVTAFSTLIPMLFI